MTILEAITQLQSIKSNQYDDETIVRWLSDADGMIYSEHIVNHHTEAEEEIQHGPYDPEMDMDTVLMVPDPYSNLYIQYLAAQVDYYNGETARYNNSMVMYNMALSAFVDWYNRNNIPVQGNYIRI